MKKPLHLSKMSLNMKAVHIQCLDANQKAIDGAYASGFVVQERDNLFLYTCWHVVTGFNMHNVATKSLPNRKFLEVNLQNCETRQPGVQAIGGNQSSILPLYDEENKPLWYQNEQHVENFSLNSIHLKVPLWHDVVKLELPKTIQLADLQYVDEDEIYHYHPLIGDKVYIVGYPYGYSVLGLEQPTAVTIVRFIASDRIKDRQTESLLDGPGVQGMSGGPIFIEHDNALFLLGIYTGIIFPDHIIGKNERITALGTMSRMHLWWNVPNGRGRI